MKFKLICILIIPITIFIFQSCINPFAPAKLDSDDDGMLLGDQTTIDGFFQNFLYAYNMKDTVLYGNLLAENFIFSYRNYDKNIDLTWTRPEDMIATYRLFNAAQNLDFVWNEILIQEGDELKRNISRSFTLTITFKPTDIVRIFGKVFFIIERKNSDDNWMLTYWQDDSTY
jgi:hypothetical protein